MVSFTSGEGEELKSKQIILRANSLCLSAHRHEGEELKPKQIILRAKF
jgi:hypothetical protein